MIALKSFQQAHEQTIKSSVSVALWSIFGAWTRLAINKIVSLDTDPIQSIFVVPFDDPLGETESISYSDFWPNIAGCLIMGILIEQVWLKQQYPTLYFGMTTGYCGSLTTFSSWMVQPFLNGFRGQWHNFVLILLTGISSYLFTLTIGTHIGKWIVSKLSITPNKVELPLVGAPTNPPTETKENSKPEPSIIYFVTASFLVVMEVLILLLLVFFHNGETGWSWWVALFAPFGALIRFLLGQYNAGYPRFPWFTFLVNVFGTVLLGLIFVYRSLRSNFGNDSIEGAIFYGLSAGFCGSLTTVSTFVVELIRLKELKDSYVYAIASVATSQILLLLSLGIFLFVKYE